MDVHPGLDAPPGDVHNAGVDETDLHGHGLEPLGVEQLLFGHAPRPHSAANSADRYPAWPARCLVESTLATPRIAASVSSFLLP